MLLHFFNNSGRNLRLIDKNRQFLILSWQHIDLPEELYDIIQEQEIPLELDYEKYIARFGSESYE